MWKDVVSDSLRCLVKFNSDNGQMFYINPTLEDWEIAPESIERRFFVGDGSLSPISVEKGLELYKKIKATNNAVHHKC